MRGDEGLYSMALLSMYVLCPLTIIPLQFLTAPYGKHSRSGWGPTISPPLAWFLMESPTLWLTLLLYTHGRHSSHPLAFLFITPFLLHYFHRTLIYPLRLIRNTNASNTSSTSKGKGGAFPLSIAATAFAFNVLNAYIQTRSVSHYAEYPQSVDLWLISRVAVGLALFGWGMWVNISSDAKLLRLKTEGGGGYKIPRGGWFDLVTCPNYMGEAAEWLGWAVLNWSPAASAFFFYTCSNLVPRAVANRKWYMEKFGAEYPSKRRAIVPFVY